MSILNIVAGPLLAILDKVVPDPEAKAKAQLELLKLQQTADGRQLEADLQVMLAQAKINEAEASSADPFKSNWRPAVGWVCVVGLMYTYLAQPLLTWASVNHGWTGPPPLDMGDLLILLGGMLGFGGMRTFERIKGKA